MDTMLVQNSINVAMVSSETTIVPDASLMKKIRSIWSPENSPSVKVKFSEIYKDYHKSKGYYI